MGQVFNNPVRLRLHLLHAFLVSENERLHRVCVNVIRSLRNFHQFALCCVQKTHSLRLFIRLRLLSEERIEPVALRLSRRIDVSKQTHPRFLYILCREFTVPNPVASSTELLHGSQHVRVVVTRKQIQSTRMHRIHTVSAPFLADVLQKILAAQNLLMINSSFLLDSADGPRQTWERHHEDSESPDSHSHILFSPSPRGWCRYRQSSVHSYPRTASSTPPTSFPHLESL